MVLTIAPSFSQVPGSSKSSGIQPGRLAGLSAWFVALDGFLEASTLDSNPEAGYQSWIEWSPAAPLPSTPGSTPGSMPAQMAVQDTPSISTAETIRVFKVSARQALDELAMISSGRSSRDDGLVQISRLPGFMSAAAALIDTRTIGTLADFAVLHDGANPLRVILAFLSSLNVRDREAFRVLAGLRMDTIVRLLDFSGTLAPKSASPGTALAVAGETRQSATTSGTAGLMKAERLLVAWRSNRLRAVQFPQGSLSHTVTRSEAGRNLAALLDTEYGRLIFNTGWAGENFAQDAKKDLEVAWSSMGRAIAGDLRREAAPWLARRLGRSGTPAFSLEYSVQPSPSNAYMALMTMRAVVDGISYSIPYQLVDRALSSAAVAQFGDAPVPLRYIEEPLPGIRIYIPRDAADSGKAIAGLEADLSAAYPAARGVPSSLLQIPTRTRSSIEDSCIALDGAFREAAVGAVLARSFSTVLHGRSFPELASRIIKTDASNMEN